MEYFRDGETRILVVEDSVSQQNFLSEILSFNGYECELADSIKKAKNLFKPNYYACALIDLGLPDGDGISLVRYFGENDPYLVKIVLTGDASSETIIGCMRAGSFDYLTKPVDLTTLSASLTRAVEHHFLLLERAELFRLLHEEREQLRARVDAATQDIRKYAASCEAGNARLRSLLQLMQMPGGYSPEQELVGRVFEETRTHIPISAIALFDQSNEKGIVAYTETTEKKDSSLTIIQKSLAPPDYDPLIAEAEPEAVFTQWVRKNTPIKINDLQVVPYPQAQWRQGNCKIAFFLPKSYSPAPNDREFIDMCAYLLAFEWERNKLLVHVACQASLGSIAVELVRGFVQPLTALRTAAGLLAETVSAPEVIEGVRVIEQNADRLWRQAQGFRKISLLRENALETVRLEDYINQALDMLSVTIQNRSVTVEKQIRTDGECLVTNGVALARTFLDIILAAIRACNVGGKIRLILQNLDEEHIVFELQHSGEHAALWADSILTTNRPGYWGENVDLGLRLAERTVQSCGGSLLIDSDKNHHGRLKIVLPRSVKTVTRGLE